MIVYKYDENGFFIGKHNCQPDPLNKGEFLKPNNFTEIAPPECQTNFLPVFSNGQWSIVENPEIVQKRENDLLIKQQKEAEEAAREAAMTVSEKRQREYQKEGVTIESMIVALWEKVVENRPEAMNQLQAKRELVKQKFPKV